MSTVSSDPSICTSAGAAGRSSSSFHVPEAPATVENRFAETKNPPAASNLGREGRGKSSSALLATATAASPQSTSRTDCFRCFAVGGQRETKRSESSRGGGGAGRTNRAYVGEPSLVACAAVVLPSRPLPDLPPPPPPPAAAAAKKRIPASTSIDLIDLVAGDDRYSNFNPGYKSTTPPDDDVVLYPPSSAAATSFCHHLSDVVVPSLPVLNELTEVLYEDLASSFFRHHHHPHQPVPSMSLGSLDGGTAASPRQAKTVRASWAGPNTINQSPSSSYEGGRHDCQQQQPPTVVDCVASSPQSPRCDETPHHHHLVPASSSSCQRSLVSKQQQQHMRLMWTPPPPRSLRGSWLSSSSSPSGCCEARPSSFSSSGQQSSHYYWELEFSGASSRRKNAADSCVAAAAPVEDDEKDDGIETPRDKRRTRSDASSLRAGSAGVGAAACCGCNRSLAFSGGTTTAAAAPPAEKTPNQRQFQLIVPYRPYKPMQLPDQAAAAAVTIGEEPSSSRGVASCSADPSGAERTPPATMTTTRDSKCSKQRCPTPPRVLSPNLDRMTCEEIADI